MSDPETYTEEENLKATENATVENEEATEEQVAPEAEVVEEKEAEVSLEDQIKDLESRLLRKQADFDNYRKRALRDLDNARLSAKLGAVEEFIPLYDNFKMAMMACNVENPDVNIILTGMNMIQSSFEKVISDLGVTEENAIGKEFNPHLHEAVAHQPSEEIAEGIVISQQRSGFSAGDRLIRPATVVVSSGVPKEAEQSGESEDV